MGLLDRIRRTPPPQPGPEEQPLSIAGRGHVDGFLQLEELNTDLIGRAGLQVYDRMYRTDGDVKQVMGLVINPIVAGTWEVQPAGGAEATKEQVDDAEFVAWALFENMAPNLKGHLHEALPILFRSGFLPCEKVWEVTTYKGQQVLTIRALQVRLPRTIYRWKQDAWGGLEAIEQYLPVPRAQVVAGPNVVIPGIVESGSTPGGQGGDDDASISDGTIVTDTKSPDYRQTVWLPIQNLVYYRVGAEGDNWEGTSMLRPCYKHWKLKDAIERMDAVAQEREALGTPVCYPPLGATPDQFDAMESILKGIRTNSQGYVLMPGPKAVSSSSGGSAGSFGQGWLLEYLAPGHGGTGRDPQPSLRYHTDKIAAAFIAEFVRLGHSMSGGSRATAQVQQDPFLISVEAIAGLIEDVLNEQIVLPLIAYNRPNAKDAPRLRMSLVDATSLTQLADFVLKLTQVGALLPDQELEDFLRERADLPPSDPNAVKERGNTDDELRREIIMGKNNRGNETGGNTGGSAPKGNSEGNPNTPSSSSDSAGRAAASSASLDAGQPGDLPPYLPGSERIRWRPQQIYELNVDLDGIEDHFDSCPAHMYELCGPEMTSLAREMAASYPKQADQDNIENLILDGLSRSYDYGAQTVSREIERHAAAGSGYSLASAHDRGRAVLEDRAKLGHRFVLDQMHQAIGHADLARGDDRAARQRAAERAGAAALREVGRVHGVAAFNHGRHDRILDEASLDNGAEWGVRYSAILDKNTCDHCREADDGVVRALDDPVRIENRPPNPHCESVASGRNQCRCIEIPEPMSSGHAGV